MLVEGISYKCKHVSDFKQILHFQAPSNVKTFHCAAQRKWNCEFGVGSQYHVWLPRLRTDTLINAPPEVILRLSPPCKHCSAWVAKQVAIKEVAVTGGVQSHTHAHTHLFQPGQQLQRSEWRRCYRQPSDTEPPTQTGSQLTPGDGTKTNVFILSEWRLSSLFIKLTACVCVLNWPQSVQWCVCSPSLWPLPEVSPRLPVSSRPSGLAFLCTTGRDSSWTHTLI